MKPTLQGIYETMCGSILHPHWLTNRLHTHSRAALRARHHVVVLDIGGGNSDNARWLDGSTIIIRLDYPCANKNYCILLKVFADVRRLPFGDHSINVGLLFEVLGRAWSGSTVPMEIQRVLKHCVCLRPSSIRSMLHRTISTVSGSMVYATTLNTAGFIHRGKTAWKPPARPHTVDESRSSRGTQDASRWDGYVAMLIAFPLSLINNLLVLLITFFSVRGACCFGYFVVAERK